MSYHAVGWMDDVGQAAADVARAAQQQLDLAVAAQKAINEAREGAALAPTTTTSDTPTTVVKQDNGGLGTTKAPATVATDLLRLPSATPSAAGVSMDSPPWLLIGASALGLYLLFGKKSSKRGRR
jgi:hypothetical protein